MNAGIFTYLKFHHVFIVKQPDAMRRNISDYKIANPEFEVRKKGF